MTERAFKLLGLFSIERPTWTAEQIASKLDVAVSSAYRLIGSLSKAGLVDAITPGQYVLGPGIIQLDRQIQLTDPLLRAAVPVMNEMITMAPPGSTILLCRAFRDHVLCVHQVIGGPQTPVSYERGRPRPLFRGATSKAILAFMPPRALKRLYGTYAEDIKSAGLGQRWSEFLGTLRGWRKAGYVLANSEVDRGRFGIAAPVLNGDRNAIGSLSYVIDADKADERTINRLAPLIMATAREVERGMSANAAAKIQPAKIGSSKNRSGSKRPKAVKPVRQRRRPAR